MILAGDSVVFRAVLQRRVRGSFSPPLMRHSGWLALLVSAAFFHGIGVFTGSAGPLRAGVSQTDITPLEPVMLAGYASRTNLSRGIHDPLSARATAFEQDGRRLVLVSVDNLGFYNDTATALRNAVLEACQLEPAEFFLCAIHTHSAPTLTLDKERGHSNNVAYTQRLRGQLPSVVRTALDRLAPIQLGIGLGSSPVGVNRREVVHDSFGSARIVLGRNPAVLFDREVQVLKLTPAGSKDFSAVVFTYATHSTSLGPRNYLVSGDIHGLAAQFLEKYLGRNVVAPVFAGASGDIDPWVRVLPEFKTANGWVPEPVLLATLLGEEVGSVLERTKDVSTEGPVKTLFKILQLPGKKRGQSEASADSASVPFTITVGRVGEIAFAGLGGEVFNELGKGIKAGSPFPHTFILTHCNGAAGYLPTRPSYAEGGYEVQSSPFGPGAGEMVVEETLRLLSELK